jgi:hypothetical protein
LTLALGIGANVAAFTVVRAVLLNPLPYSHPEQLVRVYDDLEGSKSRDVGMSAPELWDLRDKSDLFQHLSAVWPTDANVTGGDRPERIELLATTTNYFRMLAARPQLGRLYTQNDERPGFIDGVVLSDGSGGEHSEVTEMPSAGKFGVSLKGPWSRVSSIAAGLNPANALRDRGEMVERKLLITQTGIAFSSSL